MRADGKPLLEAPAHRAPIEPHCRGKQADRLVERLDHTSRDALVDDFRNRAATKPEHRRAARHRFDHHEPERFGPIDRKQQSQRVAEEFDLVAIVDLADEFHAGPIQQRRDRLAEIGFVSLVDFRGDLQRRPSALAMAMARSGRFSGEMRPRNAR